MKNEQEFLEKFLMYCETRSMFGIRNSNGGDSYNCPSCGESKEIMGYCGSTEGIGEVVHNGDCELIQMYFYAMGRLGEVDERDDE